MKFTIFVSVWLAAYAYAPIVIGPKTVGLATIAVILAAVDLLGWEPASGKEKK